MGNKYCGGRGVCTLVGISKMKVVIGLDIDIWQKLEIIHFIDK
jgi:hypothetical protein